MRSRFSVKKTKNSVLKTIAIISGNYGSYVLLQLGPAELLVSKDPVTVSGVSESIVVEDRGENYNFSNGQEINHKCGNEGKKQQYEGHPLRSSCSPQVLIKLRLLQLLQTYETFGTQ